jgi:hypothetical protein
MRHYRLSLWTLALWLLICLPLSATEWAFPIQFDKSVRKEAYTGRVYLFFGKGNREPRRGPNWFRPGYFASKDVKNLEPGESVTLAAKDDDLLFYPEKPLQFDPAGYRVQAVMRFNDWPRQAGTGPGNGYSKAVPVPAEDSDEQFEPLIVDQIVPQRTFPETDTVRLLQVDSKLMSDFYDRPVSLNGAVILPEEYDDDPERKFPTLYIIPGFGGTHFGYRGMAGLYSPVLRSTPLIMVLLDPSCPEGHHVFADSDVNGPWGTALVTEFIPALEKQHRAIPHREARYLTGHSSGGWSSLWLMVSQPETFAATWSTSPDPVTFEDFQQIDLYAKKANMYRDEEGEKRPIARVGGEVRLWYQGFDHMETVLGHGGQLRSFEAVFGPRQKDGSPVPAWDRSTGEIFPKTIEHWKRYDIVKRLEQNWDDWKPRLAGRIHVHMGTKDTFYLEGATEILKVKMTELGEPDAVTMHEGKTHGSVLTRDLMTQIGGEIAAHYEKYFQPDRTLKADDGKPRTDANR